MNGVRTHDSSGALSAARFAMRALARHATWVADRSVARDALRQHSHAT